MPTKEQRRLLVNKTQSIKNVEEFVVGQRTIKTDIARRVAASIYRNQFGDYPGLDDENYLVVGVKNQKQKFGRWINQHFSYKPEEISSYLEKFLSIKSEVKLIEGEEIYNYYQRAFGSDSCMSRKPKSYFQLYIDNPDKFKLAISVIPYRARGWIYYSDMGPVYHRIYGPAQAIIDYCEQNNIKKYNSREHRDSSIFLENKSLSDYTHYPFMDLFFYGWEKSNGLKLTSSSPYYRHDFELNSTHGRVYYRT